jgi:polyisoprenoid-binding protein YceI
MTARLLASLTAACMLAVPTFAAPQTLQVDHAASRVGFEARATMHAFQGWIETWDLQLTMPDGAEEPDVVVFKGNGMTMTTDHRKRDVELHHWMEHAAHPDVEFRLKSFSGPPTARIAQGDLMLHGVTQPISVPIVLKRDGTSMTVSGEVTLDTTAFGLPQFRKFGMLTVGTDVKVSFSVVGKLE